MLEQDGARIDARAHLSSLDKGVLRSKRAQSSLLFLLLFDSQDLFFGTRGEADSYAIMKFATQAEAAHWIHHLHRRQTPLNRYRPLTANFANRSEVAIE